MLPVAPEEAMPPGEPIRSVLPALFVNKEPVPDPAMMLVPRSNVVLPLTVQPMAPPVEAVESIVTTCVPALRKLNAVKTRPVSEGIEKVSAFRVKNRLPQLPQDAFLAAS
jgi:hypothetical protein